MCEAKIRKSKKVMYRLNCVGFLREKKRICRTASSADEEGFTEGEDSGSAAAAVWLLLKKSVHEGRDQGSCV